MRYKRNRLETNACWSVQTVCRSCLPWVQCHLLKGTESINLLCTGISQTRRGRNSSFDRRTQSQTRTRSCVEYTVFVFNSRFVPTAKNAITHFYKFICLCVVIGYDTVYCLLCIAVGKILFGLVILKAQILRQMVSLTMAFKTWFRRPCCADRAILFGSFPTVRKRLKLMVMGVSVLSRGIVERVRSI